MKTLILFALVAQAFSFPSEINVTPSGRGVFDSFLESASRLCLCRCGFPNREMRSVDANVDTSKLSQKEIITESKTDTVKPVDDPPSVSIEKSAVKYEEDEGQSKLIGGDVPPTHSFPWLVLVMRDGEVVAGGALITDRHIITAASPLASAVAYDVKARVSVHDQCAGDVTSSNVSIEAIIVHPAYVQASRAHDIALLRLSNLLRFDKRIHPICLPNARLNHGTIGTVISWLSLEGKMKTTSCEPRRVRQPILPEDDCSRAVTSPHLLTSDKSCIGVYGSRTVICSGDVGSPIQAPVSGGRYELVGILTDTNVCESTTNATLFVRIYDHINWIKDTITSDCTCRL